MNSLRLGCDVGGTFTDAVLMDGTVVYAAKTLTTAPDPFPGIVEAVRTAILTPQIDPSHIDLASLGTTSFVNAVVQRKGLAAVAVLRLGAPATLSLPPFCDFPDDLRAAVKGEWDILPGGFEFDGAQEISPLDEERSRSSISSFLRQGFRSFVIAGVNSPVNASHEHKVGDWVAAEAKAYAHAKGSTDRVYVTLSYKIAGLGLLERENAAVLNAATMPLAERIVPAFQKALAALGVTKARVYFSGNDGCLVSAEKAQQMPLLCFQSALVNSMRGAAFLSGLKDGLVADVGGTTTDLGSLVKGVPRPAAATALLAGQVRTNFPLPDCVSIGLGGGSIVSGDGGGSLSVGPLSVGHDLLRRATVVGGNELTATDVAVAVGKMTLGDGGKVAERLKSESSDFAERAWSVMQAKLEAAVDNIKTSPNDVPLIVVGGGSALCGESLAGVSRVVRPPFAEVANAVGAAIPQVGGSVDAIFKYGTAGEQRLSLLKQATGAAIAQATREGAVPESCEVVVQDELPLAYLPGGVTRVVIKVIGNLAESADRPGLNAASTRNGAPEVIWDTRPGDADTLGSASSSTESSAQQISSKGAGANDPAQWRPNVNAAGEWLLGPNDVEAISVGCGILGTGGGGSPYKAKLKVLQELRRGGCVRVVSPQTLPEHGLVGEAGHMGAPTVGVEKLDSNSAQAALLAAVAAVRTEDNHKLQLAAVIGSEIGGGNGVEPLLIGSRLQLPVCDADFMGRAFPELQMMTTAMFGLPLTPAALADEKDNTVVVSNCLNGEWLERILRPVCTAMGCSAGLATAPVTGADVRRIGVQHSLSLTYRLGQAVLAARFQKSDPVAAALKEGQGRLIFQGKVTDLQRATTEGFARGTATVSGLGCSQGKRLTIDFQNENLIAREADTVIATVPDLICCLDTQSGEPIQTEDMRYGLRISVLLLPAPELLRTPEGLAAVGPAAFGYAEEYRPTIASFVPRSIHEEFQS